MILIYKYLRGFVYITTNRIHNQMFYMVGMYRNDTMIGSTEHYGKNIIILCSPRPLATRKIYCVPTRKKTN